ncbi:MAG: hypothetical protein ACPL3C_09915 [Pyrobaculum sp.]
MTPRGVIKLVQLQHVPVPTVSAKLDEIVIKPDEIVIRAEEVVVSVEHYPPEEP